VLFDTLLPVPVLTTIAAVAVAAIAVPPVVVVPLVPAGVPALTALVVEELPVKVGAETLPLGVMVALPPVWPTSPFAARVPRSIFPFSAVTSENPAGQLVSEMMMIPEGREV